MSFSTNFLRIHYFFSKSQQIKQFMEETEVEFKIVVGKEMKKIVAQGKTKIFEHLNFKNERVQTQSSHVFMFSSELNNFSIKLMTGLKRDNEIDTSNIDLFEYNGVYFPDRNYFSCDPLPIEWLELYGTKREIEKM